MINFVYAALCNIQWATYKLPTKLAEIIKVKKLLVAKQDLAPCETGVEIVLRLV